MTATRFPLLALGRQRRPLVAVLGEGALGDRILDRLDGDRDVLDVEGAGRLAWRRADAAGDLGEVVRRMEVARREVPLALVDEIVPVGDLVVDRAAVVTIGDAAVHAARGLRLDVLFRQRLDELAIVLQPLLDRAIAAVGPVELHEAGDLAHFRRLSRRRGCVSGTVQWMARFASQRAIHFRMPGRSARSKPPSWARRV